MTIDSKHLYLRILLMVGVIPGSLYYIFAPAFSLPYKTIVHGGALALSIGLCIAIATYRSLTNRAKRDGAGRNSAGVPR
jgi:hypothetical protein